MKRILSLLLVITLTLCACTSPEEPESGEAQEIVESLDAPEDVGEDETIKDEHEESPIEEIVEIEEKPHEEEGLNLKPLELLGYYIDEESVIWTDSNDWEDCEPNIFRQYMFGTWEGADKFLGKSEKGQLVLDDSEQSFQHNLKLAYKYLRRGNTIIYLCSNYQSEIAIFWLDINEPQKMYTEWIQGGHNTPYYFPSLGTVYNPNTYSNERIPTENIEIKFLIKTDSLINEPENGYMSRLRLFELMEKYGLEYDLIFLIEYKLYDENEVPFYFVMNDFSLFPVYLISQVPDKLMFKSKLMAGYGSAYVDVIYTIEKINDKWERIEEFDLNSIKWNNE